MPALRLLQGLKKEHLGCGDSCTRVPWDSKARGGEADGSSNSLPREPTGRVCFPSFHPLPRFPMQLEKDKTIDLYVNRQLRAIPKAKQSKPGSEEA